MMKGYEFGEARYSFHSRQTFLVPQKGVSFIYSSYWSGVFYFAVLSVVFRAHHPSAHINIAQLQGTWV